MSAGNTFIFGAGAGRGQAVPAHPSQRQNNFPSSTPAAMPRDNIASAPHAQQAAFQQNGQLPGIDMSALAGISPDQVALIARLLQSGQLPLPPPPPGITAATSTPIPAQAPPAAPPSASPAIVQHEDIDMDKEEGELEDSEVDTGPAQNVTSGFSRPPPTGPRSQYARQSPQPSPRGEPAANGARTPARNLTNGQLNSRPIPQDVRSHQSREFVLAMHQAGYTYRELAQSMDDPQPLRHMFKQLGLPVSSDHGLTQPLKPSVQPSQNPPLDVTPAAHTPQRPAVAKAPAPPKAPPKADRSAYLAKLQALKAGKGGSVGTQAPSQTQQLSVSEKSPAAVAPQNMPASAASASSMTPASKLYKTELARQRLEAFKAEQAAKQRHQARAKAPTPIADSAPSGIVATEPAVAATPATPVHRGLGAGLAEIVTSVGPETSTGATEAQTASAPVNQPIPAVASVAANASFGGLPGLFMSRPSHRDSPAASFQPHQTLSPAIGDAHSPARQVTLPQKRLASSRPDSASANIKRPFGQSRSASEDESFIIENSDDEDEETHDDLSRDTNARIQSLANGSSTHGLPAKPAFQQSSPTTPGASTPGGITYEQKLKAIEELNRKIAEREAKAKAHGKSAAKTSASSHRATPNIDPLTSPVRADEPLAIATEDAGAQSGTTVSDLGPPPTVAALKLKQEKEELQRRILELEKTRYPTAAASVDVNAEPEIAVAAAVGGAPASEMPASSSQRKALMAEASEALPIAEGVTSEDDEVEDESDFDFYGDEEKPTETVRYVGSQATTESAMTESGPASNVTPARTDTGPRRSAAEEVVAMSESGIDANAIGARSTELAEPDGLDVPYEEVVLDDQVTRPTSSPSSHQESDVEMEVGDSEGDASSDVEEPDPEPEEPSLLTNVDDGSESGEVGESDSGEEDGEESSNASSIDRAESEEYEPEHHAFPTEDLAVEQVQITADDGLAAESQPDVESTSAPQLDQLSISEPKRYFKPYESILTKFKDYRYHPQYLETVPSGYKSRTYSNVIDPMKQVCRFEAQGGTCNDKNCEGQHFVSMDVNDNALLAQMGTKNIPAKTDEELKTWNAGLQRVITSLKAANVRDASTIAARIADYRREFVGDPTKIINFR